MLVITFGRAASQELRERVRAQLVEAERAWRRRGRARSADPGATERGRSPCSSTPTTTSCGRRRQRLRDALAAFDGATIATTHQFCQLVLRSLGVAGDTDPGVTLVENLDDLVEQVVDDLYLRRFGQLPDRPPFDRATALTLGLPGRRGPAGPAGRPTTTPSVGPGRLRGRGPRGGRPAQAPPGGAELRRPAQPARDGAGGRRAPARERMRHRWRIVLVDEFQDTDPVQWQVIDRAFTRPRDRRPHR